MRSIYKLYETLSSPTVMEGQAQTTMIQEQDQPRVMHGQAHRTVMQGQAQTTVNKNKITQE